MMTRHSFMESLRATFDELIALFASLAIAA